MASVAARLASGEIELELDRELAAAQDRWWREFAAGRSIPTRNRTIGPTATPHPRRQAPAPEAGTWAAAERALEEARAVQERAERALARAGGLVRQAAWADAADEQAWRTGSGGRVDAAEDAMTALRAATVADRAALHDLLARTAGGGLAERPRIALVDALSGALVALTDLPGLRRAAQRRTGLRRAPSAAHDLTGRPGSGRRHRPTATAPAPNSTGSCAPGTGAAASPAAGCRSPRANWTTGWSGRTAPPTSPTWPDSAPVTTETSTRPPASRTPRSPTAPSSSPPRPASPSPPSRRRSDPLSGAGRDQSALPTHMGAPDQSGRRWVRPCHRPSDHELGP